MDYEDFEHPHGEPFEAEDYEQPARTGLFVSTLFDWLFLAAILALVALIGFIHSKS